MSISHSIYIKQNSSFTLLPKKKDSLISTQVFPHLNNLYYSPSCDWSLQSCPALCDPMNYSPLGSSDHGIFQAILLEWVAVSFSRGSSRPRDQSCVFFVSCIRQALYHLCHLGSPTKWVTDFKIIV